MCTMHIYDKFSENWKKKKILNFYEPLCNHTSQKGKEKTFNYENYNSKNFKNSIVI